MIRIVERLSGENQIKTYDISCARIFEPPTIIGLLNIKTMRLWYAFSKEAQSHLYHLLGLAPCRRIG
nr:MAG TPA: hypothetical protein [Bacteriophage sp.]